METYAKQIITLLKHYKQIQYCFLPHQNTMFDVIITVDKIKADGVYDDSVSEINNLKRLEKLLNKEFEVNVKNNEIILTIKPLVEENVFSLEDLEYIKKTQDAITKKTKPTFPINIEA